MSVDKARIFNSLSPSCNRGIDEMNLKANIQNRIAARKSVKGLDQSHGLTILEPFELDAVGGGQTFLKKCTEIPNKFKQCTSSEWPAPAAVSDS